MATRGARPKAAHLRLIDGTHRGDRHGDVEQVRKSADASAAAFGKLSKPRHLKGEAAAAWKRYVEPAGWLDVSREPLAIAFCELWQEFRDGPRMFPATKHAQLRHYMSELGLTDERNRGADDDKDKDEFFDD
jgi:phage terminase small subunit